MEDMRVEEKFRKSFGDWIVSKSTQKMWFVDENLNLTLEYYKCKKAFIEGYKLGESGLDE